MEVKDNDDVYFGGFAQSELGFGNNMHSTPVKSAEVVDRACMERELELLRRERELIERERNLLRREREVTGQELESIVSVNVQRDVAERLIPEFDPAKLTGLTADRWVKRVEDVANTYGWSQQLILINVARKLKGAARNWLDGHEDVLTWTDFKKRLIYSFPSSMDQADLHLELSRKKKAKTEDYETYVYTMKSMAVRGGIDNGSLIKYIISGLDNRDLAKNLALCELNEVEELLAKIKRYQRTITIAGERSEGTNQKERKVYQPGREANRTMTCFKCREIGHIAKNCTRHGKDNRACYVCRKEGHIAATCPERRRDTSGRRTEDTGRQVKKIENNRKQYSGETYMKIVQIDGWQVRAFIDLGSDCTTMKESEAKRIGIQYVPYVVSLLGFGAGSCKTLGKRILLFVLDNVDFEVEVLIVPDGAQDDPMIIGRTALHQPGVRIQIENEVLSITRKAAEEAKLTSHSQEKGTVMKIRERIKEEQVEVNRDLSDQEKGKLVSLINEYRDCFAEKTEEIGTVNFAEFNMRLKDSQPVCYKPYRIPYGDRAIMKNMTDELLQSGIIRPSTSEYASPAILVNKANGEKRLCIDFRRLNDKTEKDKFPMTNMEDLLDGLAGYRYFTVVDMASGYYQLTVAEECRKYTAFVTNEGQFEFLKMPFGLVNAPAAFCRVMRKIEQMLPSGELTVYMDDVLIPSRTVDEGLEKLKRFLEVLRQVGLTLKVAKCKFLQEKVDFIGYEIDRHGIKPGSKKTKAIEMFRRPQNVHEVRQFLGLTGFFRKFVPNYAELSRPLTKLTRKNEEYRWNEEEEQAWRTLKDKLIRRPILGLYDQQAELQVHTDASKIGIAGVLLQKTGEGKWQPISFFSRQTTEAEGKYHSFELETLAVVESLERFKIYVLGKEVTVVTDCNSLKTMMTKRDLNARIARWCLKIQEYQLQIEHRSGDKMRHVDALSRNPQEEAKEPEIVDMKIMSARIADEDWLLTMQMQDNAIREIANTLKNSRREGQHKQVHTDYVLKKERVYRRTEKGERYVVPKGVIWRVIRMSHDEMGHFGEDRTMEQVKKYFWFPKMRKKVKNYIAACIECAYHKVAGGKKEGELHNIERSQIPFSTVHMDHLGPFPRSKKGNTHIIALQDNFTKYVMIRAVKDAKSMATCEFLKDVMSIFGSPRVIITDRGTAYTAKIFQDICRDNHIIHVQNATATPRANGQVERTNATITTAITTGYKEEDGKDWDCRVRDIQFAMNSMKNKTTKKSAYELLMMYEPGNVLQNQLISALQEEDEKITNEEMIERRKEALEEIEKQQKVQKQRYDRAHKRPTEYEVGDLVLIQREFAATGQPKKLAPKYKGPYQVAEKLPHDRYRLKDVSGAERTQRTFDSVFATDKMKRWCQLTEEDDTDDDNDDDVTDELNNLLQVEHGTTRGDDRQTEDGWQCQEGPTVSNEATQGVGSAPVQLTTADLRRGERGEKGTTDGQASGRVRERRARELKNREVCCPFCVQQIITLPKSNT